MLDVIHWDFVSRWELCFGKLGTRLYLCLSCGCGADRPHLKHLEYI
jgi:hypothetical protein